MNYKTFRNSIEIILNGSIGLTNPIEYIFLLNYFILNDGNYITKIIQFQIIKKQKD
jgi:hypothetical protein